MAKQDRPGRLSPINVDEVVFGIRYQPQWKIRDQLGGIIDDVLDTDPFNPDVFPNSRSSGASHALFNPTTGDRLEISERDCLLIMKVRSRDLTKVEILAENFQRHVVSALINAGLDDVLRYGFLIRLEECSGTLSDPPVNHYLGSQEGRVAGMELKFTKRLPTERATIKRSVNDFVKLIYLVAQSDEGDVHLGIDYQQYFDPALDASKIGGKGFDAFVSAGTAFYMKEFPAWLERFRHIEAA